MDTNYLRVGALETVGRSRTNLSLVMSGLQRRLNVPNADHVTYLEKGDFERNNGVSIVLRNVILMPDVILYALFPRAAQNDTIYV